MILSLSKPLIILAAVAIVAVPALADWDASIPAKWVQRPDLSDNGMDVRSGVHFQNDPWAKTLADDFECRSTGQITSIHIWGSWLRDVLPLGDARHVTFDLSIHRDIPADASGTGYSMPEPDPIWEGHFPEGTFQVRVEADNLFELFYDPNQDVGDPAPPFNGIIGDDTICFQYNFDLTQPGVVPLIQQGTPDEPVVYWLDVTAWTPDDACVFGWKTSPDHWNDDAVWWDNIPGDDPHELRYPAGHPLQGQSIDLAFVIVPEPCTVMLLLGGGALAVARKRRR